MRALDEILAALYPLAASYDLRVDTDLVIYGADAEELDEHIKQAGTLEERGYFENLEKEIQQYADLTNASMLTSSGGKMERIAGERFARMGLGDAMASSEMTGAYWRAARTPLMQGWKTQSLDGQPVAPLMGTFRAREEFYDTVKDPGCLVNLIDQPALAQQIDEFREQDEKVGTAAPAAAPKKTTASRSLEA